MWVCIVRIPSQGGYRFFKDPYVRAVMKVIVILANCFWFTMSFLIHKKFIQIGYKTGIPLFLKIIWRNLIHSKYINK